MESQNYYEKLRTVYEHHLDERVKAKVLTFPSPKYLINPPPFSFAGSLSSKSDLLSPTSEGILKTPKEEAKNEHKHKTVRFKVYNATKLEEI